MPGQRLLRLKPPAALDLGAARDKARKLDLDPVVMKIGLRGWTLFVGLLPPAALTVVSELGAAKLVDLCEIGCGSPFSAIQFFSLFAYALATPLILLAYISTYARSASIPRYLALGAVLLVSYLYLWSPEIGSVLNFSSNPFLQPPLLLSSVVLELSLGYIMATSKTAMMPLVVVIFALLGGAFVSLAGVHSGMYGTATSCSQSEILNASSPKGYTLSCSSYLTPPGPLGFAYGAILALLPVACVAALFDLFLVHSYRNVDRGDIIREKTDAVAHTPRPDQE
jgi:hypothetical protein